MTKSLSKVVLKYIDDRLVYKITNSTDGNVIKNKAGGFKSTKTTQGEHGLGVGNIEKVVDKYGGTFTADYSENTFTLGFSIPVNDTTVIK
jgi:sensor histidine kinase regulating citrate/malate metabolism